MQEINKEVQQINEKSAHIRVSIVMLSMYLHKSAMQENTTLVYKARKIKAKQQQLLNTIMKL